LICDKIRFIKRSKHHWQACQRKLIELATCKEYLQVRKEGSRQVKRNLKHYNLDMIINAFLQFNKREVLEHPGKVSAEVAKKLAIDEYDKFIV